MWGFEDWEFVVLIIGGTIMICAIALAIYMCIKDKRSNNSSLNEDLLKNNNERTIFRTISPSDRYLSDSNEDVNIDTSSSDF